MDSAFISPCLLVFGSNDLFLVACFRHWYIVARKRSNATFDARKMTARNAGHDKASYHNKVYSYGIGCR
jgi:hypothetical protein